MLEVRRAVRAGTVFFALVALSACSIYQSQDRKDLMNSGTTTLAPQRAIVVSCTVLEKAPSAAHPSFVTQPPFVARCHPVTPIVGEWSQVAPVLKSRVQEMIDSAAPFGQTNGPTTVEFVVE